MSPSAPPVERVYLSDDTLIRLGEVISITIGPSRWVDGSGSLNARQYQPVLTVALLDGMLCARLSAVFDFLFSRMPAFLATLKRAHRRSSGLVLVSGVF